MNSPPPPGTPPLPAAPVTLFLCGDVMTGRGIDQILPHPGDPTLHEAWLTSATDYARIGEAVNGPVARPAGFATIWGDALAVLDQEQPDVRIINLETSVTTCDDWEPKGINYRMHPANTPCLAAARIDCCVLANNHVLDWGVDGLAETLETLERHHLHTAGAGRTLEAAEAPAILPTGQGRVLVFALGAASSGIPPHWAATPHSPGVNLKELTEPTAEHLARRISLVRRPGDIIVASLHWGGNWGYDVPARHQAFAHQLIDIAGVDIVHGHSSHHPLGIEVYRQKPVFYGCGDFLNDYEGITGYEAFHQDLTLMHFPTLDAATGRLIALHLVPMRIAHFRLNHPAPAETDWLLATLNREGEKLGTRVTLTSSGRLEVCWQSA